MTMVDVMLDLWKYDPGDKVTVEGKTYIIVPCPTCGCNLLNKDHRCWNCKPYRIRKRKSCSVNITEDIDELKG